VGGLPSGGSSGTPDLVGSFTTTDATIEVRQIMDMPVIGAGGTFYGLLFGQQDNGVRGARVTWWGDASRNAIGTNGVQLGNIGPTGYTDAAVQPWTNIGVPAGWVLSTVNIIGTTIAFAFAGVVGQTVRWTWRIQRELVGGATP
jgi:hypothetical protein